VGLERGSLSLVSTTEELLGKKSGGSGLENHEYGSGDPLHWPRDTLYPEKLALASPTTGCRSIGVVGSRTWATEFVCLFVCLFLGCFRILPALNKTVNEWTHDILPKAPVSVGRSV
jgi:hypothetical protein